MHNRAKELLEQDWRSLDDAAFKQWLGQLRDAPELEQHTVQPAEERVVHRHGHGAGVVYKTNEKALLTNLSAPEPVPATQPEEDGGDLRNVYVTGNQEIDRTLGELFDQTIGVVVDVKRELQREIAQARAGQRGPQGERGAPGHMPTVVPWRADNISYAGMVVYHRGSSWQAMRDTSSQPALGTPDWVPLALGASDALLSMQRNLLTKFEERFAKLEARVTGVERRKR